jgi:hypothetical protein
VRSRAAHFQRSLRSDRQTALQLGAAETSLQKGWEQGQLKKQEMDPQKDLYKDQQKDLRQVQRKEQGQGQELEQEREQGQEPEQEREQGQGQRQLLALVLEQVQAQKRRRLEVPEARPATQGGQAKEAK